MNYTFDVVRALGLAAFGGFASACFYVYGYMRGRRVEQKLTLKILEGIRTEQGGALEAMRQLRKIQLEGKPRELLPRGRR